MKEAVFSVLISSTLVLCSSGASLQGLEEWQEIAREVSPHTYSVIDITPTIRGEASMERELRKVVILWRYDAEKEFGSHIESAAVQDFATRFIPTKVEFANPDKLLVAGKLGEKVMVEVWKLRPPLLFTLASGEIKLVPQALESVDLAFESDDWQPGYVQSILNNRGRPGSAFLRFSDERDLYELAWGTPGSVPTMVLSVAQEPRLANEEYNRHSAGDHVDHGYVYGFHAAGKADLVTGLRLFDYDRDGTIDAHLGIPWAQAKAMGLFDTTKWTEFGGVAPPQ